VLNHLKLTYLNPASMPHLACSGNICPSGRCRQGKCVGGDDGCGPDQLRCNGRCVWLYVDETNW